jgi:uncharacterized repeat protein (TIGR03806 family)
MRRWVLAASALAACGAPEGARHDAAAPPADAAPPDAASPDAARVSNPTCQAPPRPVPTGLEGLPPRLSETGCFDRADPTRPLPALIPYTVNVPLWSDGAEKDRWLALPDGGHIGLEGDGDFVLPPGTVLIKTFRFGARRIETRFFVRHPGGEWSGYTYQWNEAGTDASLLDEGSHRARIGDGDWHFPSRTECGTCHTPAAGHSLGLEVDQLDRAGQLQALGAMGLFDGNVSVTSSPLPAPDDAAAPLADRARAYLHANCAGCHRPGVGNTGTTDLRHSTPFAQTGSCDAEPRKGTLGLGADLRIIVPGQPDKSMLVVRMRELASGRMPPVASLRVDEAGLAVVTEWIRGLSACP